MKDAELLEAVAQHLRGKGVACKMAMERRRSVLGTLRSEAVILLAGEEVGRIEVTRHAAYGSHWFDCRFSIFLDGPLAEEASEAVKARTQVMRERKFLGVLGGEIAGVTWIGGRISGPLGQEAGLSQAFVDLARHCRLEKILIEPRGEAEVDIVCAGIPDVDAPWALASDERDHYLGQGLGLDWGVLLQLCNRIAHHVRRVVGWHDPVRTVRMRNVGMLDRLSQPWGTIPLPAPMVTASGGWLAEGY